MTQQDFFEQPFSGAPEEPAHLPSPLHQEQISAIYYLALGNRHYTSYQVRALKRDLDTAIRHYRRALEAEPSLSQAYVKLASALWDKGEINLDNAINYCHLALTYNPENADAYLFLGYFQKRSGDLAAALASFRKAIALHPLRYPKARIALGTGLINQASLSAHLPAMQRMALTGRGLAHFVLGLGLLPLDRETFGQLCNAMVADFRIHGVLLAGQALNFFHARSVSRRLYEWATSVMPSEPIFFHLLGDYYRDTANVDAAIYYYNRALELDPESLSLHRKLGKAYSHCNDSMNAVRSLEKVVELDQDDYAAMYDLAQLYTDRKEFIRALYYFKESARHEPGNPYVHSNMAYVLFKLEDYDGAIEEYGLAIHYGEDAIWTATVAQTLGTLYYQVKEDVDEAVEMFMLAHELDPGNLECMTMLAELYFEQGNLQGALDIYGAIVRCDPKNADCHNYMGYLLWQMDRNDEAIEHYNRAIACDPDNPIAYNNLGVIYLDERFSPADAHDAFGKALSLKPDYTLAAFNLGRALEALGNTADAAKHYSHALSLNAANPELADAEILERIDELFKA